MTLTEFLLARIDEDEAGAERADFIADFNQSRILDECEVKRRIVEQWAERYDDNPLVVDQETADARDTLRVLALPYIDHPEFRDEWKFWRR